MLTAFCLTGAFILLVLAVILPNGAPHRDRMAYAGLALWLAPSTVHALQAR